MYDTILVATDSSDEARAALAHAVDLAESTGAAIHVVTVLEVQGNPLQFGIGEVDALNEAAENLVDDVVATHDDSDVDIETEILRGQPAETLLEYAEDIDAGLLVAGQQGAGPITGTLVGSTTDRLAQLTDRPLLIIPIEKSDSE